MLPSLEGLPELWRTVYKGRGFTLRAVAREPRAAATARAEQAVQARLGDVLDFKMFSNLALNLLVELEATAVVGLEGTVLLDFPEGDGELVIPLPKVPG